MGKRVESAMYLSSLWALLIETIRSIRAWILLVVLLDFLFYAGAFGMVALAKSEIVANYDALNFPDPSLQQQISPEDAAAMLSQMKSFKATTITILAAVAIAIIMWWSICKGLIWSITLKEKIRATTLWRFLMLNLAWLGCWMLLISVFAYIFNFAKAQYFLLGLIGFFLLTTSSIYTFFMPSPSLAGFKKGMVVFFKKFHLLVLPSALLFMTYALASRIFMLSAHLAVQISLMAFTLLYAAFSRLYLAKVLRSLDGGWQKQA